jgi:hypothetical protein
MEPDMEHIEIQAACKLIRQWNDAFVAQKGPDLPSASLVEAVADLKRYLELKKGDGKPIRELEVAEHLLVTREGVRWVMPFVISAESMEAHQRRKEFG